MRHLMITIAAFAGAVLLFTSCGIQSKSAKSGAGSAPVTFMDSVSYILGGEIGSSFLNNHIEVNPEIFILGMKTSMAGADTLFTEEEKEQIMTTFQFRLQLAEMERRERVSAENRQEQETFMAANRNDPAVKETESGIQYRVIVMGTGERPRAADTVQVHYEGRFLDGEVFDASRLHMTEPFEFPLNRVIIGWTEALQLMPVGSTFEIYIPAHLAYGERGNERIPPAKMLIFTVELFGIVK
jgi:FKBP-type peptidyl-prolyl cis-trans isomerase FklB